MEDHYALSNTEAPDTFTETPYTAIPSRKMSLPVPSCDTYEQGNVTCKQNAQILSHGLDFSHCQSSTFGKPCEGNEDTVNHYELVTDGNSVVNRWSDRSVSSQASSEGADCDSPYVKTTDLDELSVSSSDTALAVKSILECNEKQEETQSGTVWNGYHQSDSLPTETCSHDNQDLDWEKSYFGEVLSGDVLCMRDDVSINDSNDLRIHSKDVNKSGVQGASWMTDDALSNRVVDWSCHSHWYNCFPSSRCIDPDSPLPSVVESSTECSMDTETCGETVSMLDRSTFVPSDPLKNEPSTVPPTIDRSNGYQSNSVHELQTNDCASSSQSLPNFSVFSQCTPGFRSINNTPVTSCSSATQYYYGCEDNCMSTRSSSFSIPPVRVASSALEYPLAPTPAPQVAAVAPLNHNPSGYIFPKVSDPLLPVDTRYKYSSTYHRYHEPYPHYVPTYLQYPHLSGQEVPSFMDCRSRSPFSMNPFEPERLADVGVHYPREPPVDDQNLDSYLYPPPCTTLGLETMKHSNWPTLDVYSPGMSSNRQSEFSPLAPVISKSSPCQLKSLNNTIALSSSPPESPLLTSSPSSESRAKPKDKTLPMVTPREKEIVDTPATKSSAADDDDDDDDDIQIIGSSQGDVVLDLSVVTSLAKKKPAIQVKPHMPAGCSKTVRELLEEVRFVSNPRPNINNLAPLDRTVSSPPLYGEPPLYTTSSFISPTSYHSVVQPPTGLNYRSGRGAPTSFTSCQTIPSAVRTPSASSLPMYQLRPVAHMPLQHIPVLVRGPFLPQLHARFMPAGVPFHWQPVPLVPLMPRPPTLLTQTPPVGDHSFIRVSVAKPLYFSKLADTAITTASLPFVAVKSRSQRISPAPLVNSDQRSPMGQRSEFVTVPTWSTASGSRPSVAVQEANGNQVLQVAPPLNLSKIEPSNSTVKTSLGVKDMIKCETSRVTASSSSSKKISPQSMEVNAVAACDTTLVAPKWKPKHFDFSSLSIGSYMYENSPPDARISRLKLIFSKSCLMYEFQTNSMDDTMATRKRLMAIIEVPFDSIVALSSACTCLKVQVNKIPCMYVGSKTADDSLTLPQLTSYSRDTCVDLTEGQLHVPHHLITLKNTPASKIIDLLKRFSPRLYRVANSQLNDGIPACLRMPIAEKRALTESEECEDEVHKPLKKKCLTNMRCRCNFGCRTTRCHCAQRHQLCGPSCKCKNCENPLNILLKKGMKLSDITADKCLLFNVFKSASKGYSVLPYLDKVVEFPCCKVSTVRKNCVPGIVACPNKDSCNKRYRFSWCGGMLSDVDGFPLEHCCRCGKCVELGAHIYCQTCCKCYDRSTCPVCPDPDVTRLPDKEPPLGQLAQQVADACSQQDLI